MLIHTVEVRPPANGPFFQYYSEEVQAPTALDAEQMVQRRNPGCIITHTSSRQPDRNTKSNSDSSVDFEAAKGTGLLVIGGCAVFVAFVLLPELLALGGVIGGVKLANKNKERIGKGMKRYGVTLTLMIALGLVGFGAGTVVHNAVGFERGAEVEQVQQ